MRLRGWRRLPPRGAGGKGTLPAGCAFSASEVPSRSTTDARLACPDCGLLQRLPPLSGRQCAQCRRCARILATPARGRCATPLALLLAAFVLLQPAFVAPLLRVFSLGQQESGMTAGAEVLWRQGFAFLGTVVAACGVVIPCLFLGLLIYCLASLQLGSRSGLGAVFRWASHLRPWVMLEVYLLGLFVAYSRVKTLATVQVMSGGWCLVAGTLLLLLALTQLDERTVWDSLPCERPRRAGPLTLACLVCDLVVEHTCEGGACPRCGATLRGRKPGSLTRTAALLTAGYLLYVPANVLPVLRIGYLGGEERNTIYSGVLELARARLWPLALIVLLASLVIPLLKLWGLTWMLLATHRRWPHLLRARTRLYRVIELAGRWSNIDVFMASVLVSLLSGGGLTQVHAETGLTAFAAVVVVTMFAADSFDPRLMWDAVLRAA
jgi:paraquat-inducible protein A